MKDEGWRSLMMSKYFQVQSKPKGSIIQLSIESSGKQQDFASRGHFHNSREKCLLQRESWSDSIINSFQSFLGSVFRQIYLLFAHKDAGTALLSTQVWLFVKVYFRVYRCWNKPCSAIILSNTPGPLNIQTQRERLRWVLMCTAFGRKPERWNGMKGIQSSPC